MVRGGGVGNRVELTAGDLQISGVFGRESYIRPGRIRRIQISEPENHGQEGSANEVRASINLSLLPSLAWHLGSMISRCRNRIQIRTTGDLGQEGSAGAVHVSIKVSALPIIPGSWTP